jgi:outer membrane lipoprotein-sorting protein
MARRSSPWFALLTLGAGLWAMAGAASPGRGPAMDYSQQRPDVDALLRRLDDLYRSTSSIARMEILVVTPRTTRTLRMKAWSRGEDEALVIIESPPREEGIATLRVGQNLWNYLPRISRTIRVPPSMMLGSWMGTDFTNDDLVKESSLHKDFTATLGDRSTAPPGWWIRLEVKPDIVGRWSRIEILISDDELPIEERHYDRRGRLARTMTFDDIKVLGGRRLPTHLTLVPTDTEGQRTELRYLDLQFNVTLPEDTFSLARLERGKGGQAP